MKELVANELVTLDAAQCGETHDGAGKPAVVAMALNSYDPTAEFDIELGYYPGDLSSDSDDF